MRDISSEVRQLGDVTPTSALIRRGFSRYDIDGAVRLGVLQRPRRGWVATPRADPMLVTAARAGVVVTCVTQAARLGLWVPHAPVHHVAARPNARVPPIEAERAIVHWSKPVVPRQPHALIDPVENVLALVANCLPREHALAIWESAARKKVIHLEAMRRLRLGPRAREIAASASTLSDSGGETIVVDRLRWLKERILQQVVLLDRPVDILIGDRLVIQIDGGHHVGAQREADIAHDARLKLMGYHVIRIGIRQIEDDWPAVQDRIVRAIAQGLHRAPRA